MSAPAQTKTGESMQVSIELQSDKSSLDSVELEPLNYCECDRGFGSMSSSDQAQVVNRNSQKSKVEQEERQKEVDDLKQEVTKLKCDKLDLLRQNVVSSTTCAISVQRTKLNFSLQTCQRDIKRLRERELTLQGDLASAGKEILRLRELVKDYSPQSQMSDL